MRPLLGAAAHQTGHARAHGGGVAFAADRPAAEERRARRARRRGRRAHAPRAQESNTPTPRRTLLLSPRLLRPRRARRRARACHGAATAGRCSVDPASPGRARQQAQHAVPVEAAAPDRRGRRRDAPRHAQPHARAPSGTIRRCGAAPALIAALVGPKMALAARRWRRRAERVDAWAASAWAVQEEHASRCSTQHNATLQRLRRQRPRYTEAARESLSGSSLGCGRCSSLQHSRSTRGARAVRPVPEATQSGQIHRRLGSKAQLARMAAWQRRRHSGSACAATPPGPTAGRASVEQRAAARRSGSRAADAAAEEKSEYLVAASQRSGGIFSARRLDSSEASCNGGGAWRDAGPAPRLATHVPDGCDTVTAEARLVPAHARCTSLSHTIPDSRRRRPSCHDRSPHTPGPPARSAAVWCWGVRLLSASRRATDMLAARNVRAPAGKDEFECPGASASMKHGARMSEPLQAQATAACFRATALSRGKNVAQSPRSRPKLRRGEACAPE
jgi:hypothetical protein